jgi:hypothetical protein
MNYRNPKYNQWGTFDCEVNHPEFGWVPYTASPDDCEKHGRQLWEILSKGKVAPYVPPPPPNDEEIAAQVLEIRDALLAQSDWTQLTDVPEATREAWAEYRQALRDVPQQPGFPNIITWPEKSHG